MTSITTTSNEASELTSFEREMLRLQAENNKLLREGNRILGENNAILKQNYRLILSLEENIRKIKFNTS